jgi:hypothetical protein
VIENEMTPAKTAIGFIALNKLVCGLRAEQLRRNSLAADNTKIKRNKKKKGFINFFFIFFNGS